MKRMVLVLTVVAVMVAMVAMSVTPALAERQYCYDNYGYGKGEPQHPCGPQKK